MSTPRHRPRLARSRTVVTALVAVLLVLLASCGGSDSAEEASARNADALSSDAEAPRGADGGVAESLVGDEGDGGGGGTAGRVEVQTRAVISTGEVTLVAEDLATVRDEVDRMLGRYGGFVADERTTNDEEGRTTRSVLRLRVPAQHFDTVMGSFDDLATVESTRREAQDVTTEVIDLDARISTQQASLARLRSFLREARDVETMIRVESEIARREATLESLQAQADYLADQVDLATVVVTMRTPDAAPPDDDPLEGAGFVAGLRTGWQAMVDLWIVGATGLGAAVPFTALALVVGLPLWVWQRGLRRRRTAS